MSERRAPVLARLLAAAISPKAARPARPQNGQHRYSACHDSDCQRPLCIAYREGWLDGYSAGYSAGFSAGFAAGAAAAGGK